MRQRVVDSARKRERKYGVEVRDAKGNESASTVPIRAPRNEISYLVKSGWLGQNDRRRNFGVEKGFNSDVIFKGMNFHVQTEDWGAQNPYLVSRVYQNGAVIRSVKTPYSDVLGSGLFNRPPIDPQAIRLALREQHQKILDLLLSGQLF